MKLLYSYRFVSDMVVVLCHYTRMVHCLCIIAPSGRQFAWIHPTGARGNSMDARIRHPSVLVAGISSTTFETVSTTKQIVEKPAIMVQTP